MKIIKSFKQLITKHKKLSATAGTALVIFLLLNFYIIQPISFLYGKSKTLRGSLRPIIAAINRRDLKTLDFELKYLRDDLVQSKNAVDKISVFSFLPLAGPYVTDLKNVADASLEGYDTALAMTSYLAPLFPNITFEGWGGGKLSYGGKMDVGKLAETLPFVSQELVKYKKNFESISGKLITIDENRYPESLKGRPIKKYVGDLRQVSSVINKYFDDIVGALNITPEILGINGSKNYLIIVQNDLEMRPGGGLLGGYAFLSIENSNFKLIKSGDVSFLDKETTKPRPIPPSFLSRFLNTRALYLKDANFDPDFKISAQTIRSIWLSTPRSFDIEGMIVIDRQFLKTLIDTIGEIKLEDGRVINAQNVDETLDGFFSFVGNQSLESRKYKNLTSILLNELLKKSFSYSTHNFNELIQKIMAMAKSKHLLFYSTDEKLQTLAEKYNAAGSIRNFDGDYLLVNDAVYSPNRSNWNVNQTVTKTTEVRNGKLITRLTIELEGHPRPKSPADAGNSHFIRIYVPKGSILTNAIGSKEPTLQKEESEKTVFSSVITLDPNQKKTLTINYTSPKPSFENGRYKLLIQKQPGTENFKYTITVGSEVEELVLSEDKEIEIKL